MRETVINSLVTMAMVGTVSLTATFPEPQDLKFWVQDTVREAPVARTNGVYLGNGSAPKSVSYQPHSLVEDCLDLPYDADRATLRHCAHVLPGLLDSVNYGDTMVVPAGAETSRQLPGTEAHRAAIHICRIMWVRGDGSWGALEQPLCSLAGIELDSLRRRV